MNISKSTLQEYVQKKYKTLPVYNMDYLVFKGLFQASITLGNMKYTGPPMPTKCGAESAVAKVALDECATDVEKVSIQITKLPKIELWILEGYWKVIDFFSLKDSSNTRRFITGAFTHTCSLESHQILEKFIFQNEKTDFLIKHSGLSILGDSVLRTYQTCHIFNNLFDKSDPSSKDLIQERQLIESRVFIKKQFKKLDFLKYIICEPELDVENSKLSVEIIMALIGAIFRLREGNMATVLQKMKLFSI